MQQQPTPTPGAARLLALGDSYTIGQGVAEDARWPMRLVARLREQGIVIDMPEIIAKTGWTTDDLAHAIDQRQPHGPYDLVTLLIGVNDQYGGRAVEEYRPRFRALLQQAITLAGGRAAHVIVISIPDWSVTPFATRFDPAEISAEIGRYNAVNREETQHEGILYIDITPNSRMAMGDSTLLADDGLHPSAKMYDAWVQLILPAAQAAL
ncbi:MAG: SGNH/GDSL hydrolase family protein [Chloroflexota bacterium]|nr:SGNH/GDSL hydrolase family protein [Chloroflexota bacterium]